jgi:hypothetical protein
VGVGVELVGLHRRRGNCRSGVCRGCFGSRRIFVGEARQTRYAHFQNSRSPLINLINKFGAYNYIPLFPIVDVLDTLSLSSLK